MDPGRGSWGGLGGGAEPRTARERLNPPPPEGSERVRMDFEIFFEFFELKESSQGPRSPQGSPPSKKKTLIQPPGLPTFGPKSVQKSIKMLMSLWSRFGRLLGPFGPPFWELLGAQIGPRGSKTHLEMSFVQKC